LLFCCSNPKEKNGDDLNKTSDLDTQGISPGKDYLKKYQEPSQIFKISLTKASIISGKKGTKIFVDPNNLETITGKPLGENAQLELIELSNQRQLLKTNAQTTADGKILISGGAYYIDINSNGEQLKLKEGKQMNVQFPVLNNTKMDLFYGERDKSGRINWSLSSQTFSVTNSSQNFKDSVKIIRKKSKSDIESIVDYLNGDTTTTPEGRARAAKWEKANQQRQKLYDAIGLSKLGWINCDKFLDYENKTDLYVELDPTSKNSDVQMYVVFKDINSVLQSEYNDKKPNKFDNLPVGYKVRLIAYNMKDEIFSAYSQDITISKNQKINITLQKIEEKYFQKLLNN